MEAEAWDAKASRIASGGIAKGIIMDRKLEDAHARIKSMEDMLKKREVRIEELEARIIDREKVIVALNLEVANLRKYIGQVEDMSQTLQEALIKAKTRVEELEAKIQKLDASLQANEGLKDKLRAELEDAKEQIDKSKYYQERADRLAAERDELDSCIDKDAKYWHNAYDEVAKKIHALVDQTRDAQEYHAQKRAILKGRISQMQADKMKLAEEIRRLLSE